MKDLPDFDAAELGALDQLEIRPLWDDAAAAGKNVVASIAEERRLVRRADKRHTANLLRVANAAAELDTLPGEGETLHAIMRGNFNAWDLVPAILRLANGAHFRQLSIATLGFNRHAADELVALVDAGRAERVAFVVSHYFRCTDDLFGYLFEQLSSRGHRCAWLRSHAKVVAMQLTDGRELTIESSANLRSCNNLEQFSLTNDRALRRFHAGWIDELLTTALADNPQQTP